VVVVVSGQHDSSGSSISFIPRERAWVGSRGKSLPRGSSVSIVTEVPPGRPGFDSLRGQGFVFSTASRPVLGSTQPPIRWVPRGLSPGVKGPEMEADHSPKSSAEVENAWSYTSTPQYAFMVWCVVKAQGIK
jgi:hypothetical protein